MEGLILAAGLSTRFKGYKMTQKIDELTLIEKTVLSMEPFVDHIYVVTGHKEDAIKTLLNSYENVTCVYNEQYEKGMFESIKCGLLYITDDFFVLPGDCGFVQDETFKALIKSDGDVRIPSYHYKGGHPIYLSIALKSQILKTDKPHLRAFLKDCNKEYVVVNDPFILVDIDTKEDLKEVRRKIE